MIQQRLKDWRDTFGIHVQLQQHQVFRVWVNGDTEGYAFRFDHDSTSPFINIEVSALSYLGNYVSGGSFQRTSLADAIGIEAVDALIEITVKK